MICSRIEGIFDGKGVEFGGGSGVVVGKDRYECVELICQGRGESR